MAKVQYFVLAAAAVLTARGGNALANNVTATTAEKTAPSGPTKVALVTLEKSAYAAWKSKDSKFWDTFLSDKFVGWGSSGRLDKASATKEYTGADCEIESYAVSDEQVSPRGKNAALITYKATIQGTCGGQEIPSNSWAASVYVREGDQWKAVFHAEDSIVDPKAVPAKPVGKSEARKEDDSKPADQDAHTAAMLVAEKAVWEAWRAHDAKKLEGLTATNISFINIFGTHLATKADALKNWSGAGCDVRSVSLREAAGTMLSPAVGILTFKATADGTCYGQKVGPIWGTSVYVKYGDVWKWTFGINVPARLEGG
jgi:hypothetical protein